MAKKKIVDIDYRINVKITQKGSLATLQNEFKKIQQFMKKAYSRSPNQYYGLSSYASQLGYKDYKPRTYYRFGKMPTISVSKQLHDHMRMLNKILDEQILVAQLSNKVIIDHMKHLQAMMPKNIRPSQVPAYTRYLSELLDQFEGSIAEAFSDKTLNQVIRRDQDKYRAARIPRKANLAMLKYSMYQKLHEALDIPELIFGLMSDITNIEEVQKVIEDNWDKSIAHIRNQLKTSIRIPDVTKAAFHDVAQLMQRWIVGFADLVGISEDTMLNIVMQIGEDITGSTHRGLNMLMGLNILRETLNNMKPDKEGYQEIAELIKKIPFPLHSPIRVEEIKSWYATEEEWYREGLDSLKREIANAQRMAARYAERAKNIKENRAARLEDIQKGAKEMIVKLEKSVAPDYEDLVREMGLIARTGLEYKDEISSGGFLYTEEMFNNPDVFKAINARAVTLGYGQYIRQRREEFEKLQNAIFEKGLYKDPEVLKQTLLNQFRTEALPKVVKHMGIKNAVEVVEQAINGLYDAEDEYTKAIFESINKAWNMYKNAVNHIVDTAALSEAGESEAEMKRRAMQALAATKEAYIGTTTYTAKLSSFNESRMKELIDKYYARYFGDLLKLQADTAFQHKAEDYEERLAQAKAKGESITLSKGKWLEEPDIARPSAYEVFVPEKKREGKDFTRIYRLQQIGLESSGEAYRQFQKIVEAPDLMRVFKPFDEIWSPARPESMFDKRIFKYLDTIEEIFTKFKGLPQKMKQELYSMGAPDKWKEYFTTLRNAITTYRRSWKVAQKAKKEIDKYVEGYGDQIKKAFEILETARPVTELGKRTEEAIYALDIRDEKGRLIQEAPEELKEAMRKYAMFAEARDRLKNSMIVAPEPGKTLNLRTLQFMYPLLDAMQRVGAFAGTKVTSDLEGFRVTKSKIGYYSPEKLKDIVTNLNVFEKLDDLLNLNNTRGPEFDYYTNAQQQLAEQLLGENWEDMSLDEENWGFAQLENEGMDQFKRGLIGERIGDMRIVEPDRDMANTARLIAEKLKKLKVSVGAIEKLGEIEDIGIDQVSANKNISKFITNLRMTLAGLANLDFTKDVQQLINDIKAHHTLNPREFIAKLVTPDEVKSEFIEPIQEMFENLDEYTTEFVHEMLKASNIKFSKSKIKKARFIVEEPNFSVKKFKEAINNELDKMLSAIGKKPENFKSVAQKFDAIYEAIDKDAKALVEYFSKDATSKQRTLENDLENYLLQELIGFKYTKEYSSRTEEFNKGVIRQMVDNMKALYEAPITEWRKEYQQVASQFKNNDAFKSDYERSQKIVMTQKKFAERLEAALRKRAEFLEKLQFATSDRLLSELSEEFKAEVEKYANEVEGGLDLDELIQGEDQMIKRLADTYQRLFFDFFNNAYRKYFANFPLDLEAIANYDKIMPIKTKLDSLINKYGSSKGDKRKGILKDIQQSFDELTSLSIDYISTVENILSKTFGTSLYNKEFNASPQEVMNAFMLQSKEEAKRLIDIVQTGDRSKEAREYLREIGRRYVEGIRKNVEALSEASKLPTINEVLDAVSGLDNIRFDYKKLGEEAISQAISTLFDAIFNSQEIEDVQKAHEKLVEFQRVSLEGLKNKTDFAYQEILDSMFKGATQSARNALRNTMVANINAEIEDMLRKHFRGLDVNAMLKEYMGVLKGDSQLEEVIRSQLITKYGKLRDAIVKQYTQVFADIQNQIVENLKAAGQYSPQIEELLSAIVQNRIKAMEEGLDDELKKQMSVASEALHGVIKEIGKSALIEKWKRASVEVVMSALSVVMTFSLVSANFARLADQFDRLERAARSAKAMLQTFNDAGMSAFSGMLGDAERKIMEFAQVFGFEINDMARAMQDVIAQSDNLTEAWNKMAVASTYAYATGSTLEQAINLVGSAMEGSQRSMKKLARSLGMEFSPTGKVMLDKKAQERLTALVGSQYSTATYWQNYSKALSMQIGASVDDVYDAFQIWWARFTMGIKEAFASDDVATYLKPVKSAMTTWGVVIRMLSNSLSKMSTTLLALYAVMGLSTTLWQYFSVTMKTFTVLVFGSSVEMSKVTSGAGRIISNAFNLLTRALASAIMRLNSSITQASAMMYAKWAVFIGTIAAIVGLFMTATSMFTSSMKKAQQEIDYSVNWFKDIYRDLPNKIKKVGSGEVGAKIIDTLAKQFNGLIDAANQYYQELEEIYSKDPMPDETMVIGLNHAARYAEYAQQLQKDFDKLSTLHQSIVTRYKQGASYTKDLAKAYDVVSDIIDKLKKLKGTPLGKEYNLDKLDLTTFQSELQKALSPASEAETILGQLVGTTQGITDLIKKYEIKLKEQQQTSEGLLSTLLGLVGEYANATYDFGTNALVKAAQAGLKYFQAFYKPEYAELLKHIGGQPMLSKYIKRTNEMVVEIMKKTYYDSLGIWQDWSVKIGNYQENLLSNWAKNLLKYSGDIQGKTPNFNELWQEIFQTASITKDQLLKEAMGEGEEDKDIDADKVNVFGEEIKIPGLNPGDNNGTCPAPDASKPWPEWLQKFTQNFFGLGGSDEGDNNSSGGLLEWIKGVSQKAWESIKQGAINFWNDVKDFKLGSKLFTWLQGEWDDIINGLQTSVAGLDFTDVINKAGAKVEEAYNKVKEAIGSWDLNKLSQDILGDIGDTIAKIEEKINGLDLAQIFKDTSGDVWDWFKKKIGEVADAGKNGADFFGNMFSAIERALSGGKGLANGQKIDISLNVNGQTVHGIIERQGNTYKVAYDLPREMWDAPLGMTNVG